MRIVVALGGGMHRCAGASVPRLRYSGGIFVGTGEGEGTPLSAEIPPAVSAAGFSQPGNARMEPEIIIGALALFVSGGALGAAGMLLSQWVVGRMSPRDEAGYTVWTDETSRR